jgi:serine/threonine protein kinase/tetratricopeptide (TPR) repeat protein
LELTSISRYRIIEKLGAGGMGEVFLAEDTKLGRKVALKLLSEGLTQNRDRLSRFDQEAYAASALNHPNILTIYEMGDDGGRHFIATEFIDGITLRKRLAKSPMDLSEVLDIAIQVAGALDEAHGAGIVHRDIKPENIMVRRNGHVKVLDFGLAKLTERPQSEETDTEAVTRALVQTDAGVVLGTSQYMSPEQARGKPVDARTDIWSLGVVLYEMACGRAPFTGETKTDVIVAIARTDPLPMVRYTPNAPAELEWIVMKALRKDIDERYQTVKELESDLKKLKQRLEFQTELERSMSPERFSGTVNALADTEIPGIPRLSTHSTLPAATPPARVVPDAQTRTSNSESLVSEIKRHKKGVALSVLAIALVGVIIGYFTFAPKRSGFTDKDTILLADFVNTTGEPVFDGTLKQALAVQLGQSPFLDIFSAERVHETLRFMNRPPDSRVTRDVAKEICVRQGIKAMLIGTISGLGNNYVISLEAFNSQTGDTLASEQVEAEGKEQVLKALGQAASKLREKLGESLNSIKKFDAPIEQVTTSSLPALKEYSLGVQQHSGGRYFDAIRLYKSAIQTDQNFAIAYARLAAAYNSTRQFQLSREASQKAYDLRDRAGEREKFLISWSYYGGVTGEWDKTDEVLEMWKRTYPRDWEPFNRLANRYTLVGPFEKAIAEGREAIRLNPMAPGAYVNQAVAYIGLNRFDEAKKMLGQALSEKLETSAMHSRLFHIAFLQGDATGMKEQIDWAAGRPDEYLAQNWQAQAAEFSGQAGRANEFAARAIELAQRGELKEPAAQAMLHQAERNATFGNCGDVSRIIEMALIPSREQAGLVLAASAHAACGQSGPAQALLTELSRRFPTDTLLNTVSIPLIKARLELSRGNATQAIQLLEPARKYEVYGDFWPQYLRGQAHLMQKNYPQAIAEFQTIIDHRGWHPLSPLYPLAHLGLARAAQSSGDSSRARKAYQDFLALWKDADPTIPILVQARQEYDKLK